MSGKKYQIGLGTICAIMGPKKEGVSSQQFFVEWTDEREVVEYVTAVAEIYICLSVLCEYFHFKLGDILQDKIIKNDRKYPVDLVKGCSAKYTAYASQVADRQK